MPADNAANPTISATAVMDGGGTTRSAAVAAAGDLLSGIDLQEVELRLSAVVDPYFRADIMLAGNVEEVGFEEAYLSTLALPHVTVRAGQMRANLGRHNLLHTHAFPFLTAPLPSRVLLGDEGLADPGVSLDVLIPLPFFAEANLQAFAGQWDAFAGGTVMDPAGNDVEIDTRKGQDLVYVSHLKTLFELGGATTLELGGTYLAGRNGFGALSQVAAADLTLRWRPPEAERYTGLEWSSEYMWLERQGVPGDRRVGGGFTALRYQFAQRFWMQGRHALLGIPVGESGRQHRSEALLAFIPTEFSALRLQYAFEPARRDSRAVHEVFVQAIVSIGAHPAHAY